MRKPSRYLQVMKMTWKAMIAYQADTWLGALISGFRVLLSFLLWRAIFSGQPEVGGYTLPMMITYSLIASMLGRLQHQDALAWQLTGEVREGTFSKYLVRPMPVIHFFITSGLGRWSYLLLINAGALAAWAAVFSSWLVLPPHPANLLWLLLLLPLGAVFMLLLNHTVALLSLKFQDATGMMMIKGAIIEFISGAIIPLQLLPDPITSVLKFTPFYYVIYYPTSLFLGTQSEPPIFAALVLTFWSVAFYAIAQAWFFYARRHYEGVGI